MMRGDETPRKERLEIFGAISDDNALWLAVQNRQLASFSSLLQQGVPVTARVLHAILESCTNQGSKFLEAWLREDESVDGYYDDSTPLKLALGQETCVRWLLNYGANPNVRPQIGHRVDLLTLAAASSPPSVVRLLVEHGARTTGTQALHAAATKSANEFDGGSFQPVPSRVEILAILLEHGADANEMEVDPKELGRPRASWNGTPLHRAVKDGSLEAVQCLLAHGADVLAPSWSGLTALQAAQMCRRQDIVDELRKHIDRVSGP